ncbi:MAG: hypothetical protein ABIO70_20980 [Pseudomonadota bacterium]
MPPDFNSPFRRSHERSSRFGRIAMERTAAGHLQTLYGQRTTKHPLSALRVQQDLGACRHALSRMVVAGIMTITPPIHIAPSRDGERSHDTPNSEHS